MIYQRKNKPRIFPTNSKDKLILGRINRKQKHLVWKIKQSLRYLSIFLPIGHLRDYDFASGSHTLRNSFLGSDGQLIYLQHDKVMAPYVNRFGYWDNDLSKFIISHLNNSKGQSIFLDIGANQGLVTLQVINGCNNLKNIEFILIEPISEFFSNLQKNFQPLNGVALYELLNFGLGLVSNPGTYAYTSKRNSTSTQHLNLSRELGDKDKFKINDIAIVSVSKFIESYLDIKIYSQLVIKSDTDGNDLEIFNCFVNSALRAKLSLYILEVILTSITKTDLDIFIKNCSSFNIWILKLRNGEELKNKTKIKNILETERGNIGDLYLIS